MLKVKSLPTLLDLRKVSSDIWTYVLNHNTSLFLRLDPSAYHLMVDWSAKGVGYALFAGHLSQSNLGRLNSKRMSSDSSSSFLDELKGLVWDLNDTKSMIQSKPL